MSAKKPFKTYVGGKNGSGVYQAIINQIPPHKIFISGYAGNCGILANKKKALLANIAIDVDASVINGWDTVQDICTVKEEFLTVLYGLLRNYEDWEKEELFFFLDPPYLKESRKDKRAYYKNEMLDLTSHKEMLSAAKKIPFNVCIVHYPNELYDEELKHWRKVDIKGRSRTGIVTERLYMNFEEPTQLHDYSFFGDNFRSRAAYKKSIKNMKLKFCRMTILEQNFYINEIINYATPNNSSLS